MFTSGLIRTALVPLATVLLALPAAAQWFDIVGNSTSSANGSARAAGNSFVVTSPAMLVEVEFRLELTGQQDMRMTVHSSPTEFAHYTEVFARTVPMTGTGLRHYSSGPLIVPLRLGEHYIIAVSWPGTLRYDFGVNDSQPVSLGVVWAAPTVGRRRAPGTEPGQSPPLIRVLQRKARSFVELD